jgi:hypothetical protein
MELEHQHDRRLPDTDSEPNGDGVAIGHAGYPDADSDSNAHDYTDSYPNGNAHSYSSSYAFADSDTFGFALGHAMRHHGLHVCERGAHHHQ